MKAINLVPWGSIHIASRGRLSLLDRLFVGMSLAGVLVWAFPHIAAAQTMQEMPFVFEIKTLQDYAVVDNVLTPVVQEDYFAKLLAKTVPTEAPEITDPKVTMLEQYLNEKNSPLAPHAETLLLQYHYRLILGISFAESNFCKHQIKPHNCWGIGGGQPETYGNYDEAVIRANNLIQKYFDNGMQNPQQMRNTWVGWQNPNWVIAVQQVTQELESRGL